MILLIDNYDSFTYNLVQLLGGIGREREDLWHELIVIRNDRAELDELQLLKPDFLIISPGPCTPKVAGVSNEAIRHFQGRIPVLGVCLGHQCIAEVFGARVERADRIMHGKTSEVHHDGRTIFSDLPNPFTAMRYHSLHVPPLSLGPGWEVSARTAEGECMALRHATAPTEGVQFHPESFLTPDGKRLMTNFLTRRDKTPDGIPG